MFALRPGEVSNLEVGADYVAFDTELVRYPDRGERHYPDPWTDRFRATVALAQLYQLCHQVLPPEELTTGQITYGPDTVVYYNAQVHQRYITPPEMNQPYAAPAGTEHPLVLVMSALADEASRPAQPLLVNTSYFEGPNGPVLLRHLALARAHGVAQSKTFPGSCQA